MEEIQVELGLALLKTARGISFDAPPSVSEAVDVFLFGYDDDGGMDARKAAGDVNTPEAIRDRPLSRVQLAEALKTAEDRIDELEQEIDSAELAIQQITNVTTIIEQVLEV